MSSITSDKLRRRQNAMKVIFDPAKGFKFESPYHVGVWLVIDDEVDIDSIDLSGMTGGDEITLHVSGRVEVGDANLCDYPPMESGDVLSGAVVIRCIDGVRYMQGGKKADPPILTPFIYGAEYSEGEDSIKFKLANAITGRLDGKDIILSINGADASDNISSVTEGRVFFASPPPAGVAIFMFKSSAFLDSNYDSNATMCITPEPRDK